MGFKKWRFGTRDDTLSRQICERLGVSSLMASLLVSRGLADEEQAAVFLSQENELSDPFLLKDMDKAAERIGKALYQNEKIVIYGDYDADGVTATSLVFTYLDATGADVSYYIPSREGEGYGLNRAALKSLHDQGFSLVITVDNGITAIDEIAYANAIGLDVIVTDHHQPKSVLPPAVAVVDPHRPDCESPCKNLAGVGVALKLVCALEGGDTDSILYHYADLAMIGTVADIVPLTGENRILTRAGLERLANTENPGLRALLAHGGTAGRELTAQSVQFSLVPRINAAGRLGDAQAAVELLCCEDAETASALAAEVSEKNTRRKELETAILEDIERQIAQDPALTGGRLICLSGVGWHHGVVGIVASKIVERYEKPCFLISIEGAEARASGRSFGDFSLFELLQSCDDLLIRYGGHVCAAGFTIKTENIPLLKERIDIWAKQHFDEMPVLSISIDMAAEPSDLTLAAVKELAALEPFGTGNEPPMIALRQVVIDAIYPVSEGKHIRMRLRGADGTCVYAVYFGMSPQAFPFRPGSRADVAASIGISLYQGEERLNIIVRDVRPALPNQDKFFRAKQTYEKYKRQETLPASFAPAMLPSREELAVVYKALRQCREYPYGCDMLCASLANPKINYCKLRICLDILCELSMAEVSGNVIRVLPSPQKRPMETSQVYQGLSAQFEKGD